MCCYYYSSRCFSSKLRAGRNRYSYCISCCSNRCNSTSCSQNTFRKYCSDDYTSN